MGKQEPDVEMHKRVFKSLSQPKEENKMRNRFWTIISLLLIVMLALVACGQQSVPEPAESADEAAVEEPAADAEDTDEPVEEESVAEPATDPGEVDLSEGSLALILTGPTDDNSWNEVAYTALKALEEQGVRTTYAERVPNPDTERLMRELVDDGYQMIVGHSFNHQDAAFTLAEEYPDVNFAWGGGIGRTAENVADYDQPFYQVAYLVGIIAGHVSETGKLGAIYAFDIPVCHAMGEAFVLGAQRVNPDAELLSTASGDWYDISKAKEAALAQAEQGVDYWVTCGQGPTFGSIEAAKEQGGYATGYVGDMTEAGPDVVLTNIVWNLKPMFENMVRTTLAGTFDGPYYEYGIPEGALELGVNPELADVIPAEAMEEVEAVQAQIASGEFEVPFIPE